MNSYYKIAPYFPEEKTITWSAQVVESKLKAIGNLKGRNAGLLQEDLSIKKFNWITRLFWNLISFIPFKPFKRRLNKKSIYGGDLGRSRYLLQQIGTQIPDDQSIKKIYGKAVGKFQEIAPKYFPRLSRKADSLQTQSDRIAYYCNIVDSGSYGDVSRIFWKFDRLIIGGTTFQERLKLCKAIKKRLGHLPDPEDVLRPTGFIEDIKKCNNFQERMKLINILFAELDEDIANFIRVQIYNDFEQVGFVEDLNSCKSAQERLEMCYNIIKLGDDVSAGLAQNLHNIDLEEIILKERLKLYSTIAKQGDSAAIGVLNFLKTFKNEELTIEDQINLFYKILRLSFQAGIEIFNLLDCHKNPLPIVPTEHHKNKIFFGLLSYIHQMGEFQSTMYLDFISNTDLRLFLLGSTLMSSSQNTSGSFLPGDAWTSIKFKPVFDELCKSGGNTLTPEQENALEKFIHTEKKLNPLLLPLLEKIKKKKNEVVRFKLQQWLAACFGVLNFLNDKELETIEKSGLLNEIYNYKNPTSRFAFVNQLMFIDTEELKSLPEGAKVKKWSRLSWLLLSRLKQHGFSEKSVQLLLEKINGVSGFKDTKRFDHLVKFMLAIMEEGPFPEKEIKQIEHALTTILGKKNPKKFKKGEKPKKKLIQQISRDLQDLTSIIKFFGKQEFLKCLESETEISTFFQEKFQALFDLEEIEDFGERYEKTFGSFRDNTALYTYLRSVNKLPPNQSKKVKSALSAYVNAVLKGTFPAVRYDETLSPHLKALFEGNPELKKQWLYAEGAKVLAKTTAAEPVKINYKDFLYQKIITDKHLNTAMFPVLRDYLLTGEKKELETSEDPTVIFQSLAIDLCEGKVQVEEFLKTAHNLVLPLGEFSNDLKSLHPQQQYTGEYAISESDDPCDLLLIGTEINGSCQNVGGTPSLNKSLVSYLMNGEIRPIVVKRGETLAARALLRLLIDEQNKTPVLLLERIYSNVEDATVKQAIQAWAQEKAEKMGVPLVSKEVGGGKPYPGTVQFLGGFAPYTYSDASSEGTVDGPTTIEGCHILHSPAA